MNQYQESSKISGTIPHVWVESNRLTDAGFTDCAGEYFPKNMMVQVKCNDIDKTKLQNINLHEDFSNKQGESFSVSISTDALMLSGNNWLFSGSLISSKVIKERMTPTSAIFNVPKAQGVYWYYCEDKEKFVICDVVEKDGEFRAKFTNGSFQRWCGKKSYFIGPITDPIINEDGTWK